KGGDSWLFLQRLPRHPTNALFVTSHKYNDFDLKHRFFLSAREDEEFTSDARPIGSSRSGNINIDSNGLLTFTPDNGRKRKLWERTSHPKPCGGHRDAGHDPKGSPSKGIDFPENL
ncbi:hypothetical protein, partial [Pseudomonas amygdali]|uniref:hypothetical protein n=4 Tax=Pseudomonas amygdali TaxID=47877 RepID=UPI001E559021